VWVYVGYTWGIRGTPIAGGPFGAEGAEPKTVSNFINSRAGAGPGPGLGRGRAVSSRPGRAGAAGASRGEPLANTHRDENL